MLVWNNNPSLFKIFDVTAADKVLIPLSSSNFTVYLVAQGGDFEIMLKASSAIKAALSLLFVASIAIMSFVF